MKMIRDIAKNYRFWVLALLTGVALVCLLGEPTACALVGWMTTLVLSKMAGVVVMYVAVRLFLRWARQGKITCLTKFIGEN